MPTYVYKFVKTGETIEVQQAFDEDTLTKYKHPETGRVMTVKKVFQPVGVTFKGSGFFKNDNRGSSTTTTTTSESSSGSESNGSTSDSSSSTGSSSSTESSSASDTAKPAKPSKSTSASNGSSTD